MVEGNRNEIVDVSVDLTRKFGVDVHIDWSALPNGMVSGKIIGAGMDLLWGLCVSVTSHSSQSSMSLARSVIISAMGHHLKGHGEPPKVSRNEISPMSSMTVEQAAAL